MFSTSWSEVYFDVIFGLPTNVPGILQPYADLRSRSVSFDLDGPIVVYVGSLDDIIESKLATNRPSDQVALPELFDLQAALNQPDNNNPGMRFDR